MVESSEVVLGWSYPQRKRFIEELYASKDNTSKHSFRIKFQTRHDTYPVFLVSIDLPKYRLENGRTQAAQEEYLARNPQLGVNFFRADKESEQAQRIQHQLLSEMVNKNNLLSYFRNQENKQIEPLILTNEGYVVNGNRRLCAMRELLHTDSRKYSHFANIEVIFLPVCISQDIDELEAYLQIQEDIKADYSWIAEACMLRVRRDQHVYDDEALSRIYDKPVKEIKAIFQRLSLVDEFLNGIGKDKQYDFVEDKEYAFKQLQKGRQQTKSENLKDIFTQISFALIGGSEVTGRLYDRIPEVKEYLLDIIQKISEEIKLPAAEQKVEKPNVLGNPTQNVSPVTNAVTTIKDKSKLIDIVLDVIDGNKEIERKRSKEKSVFNEIAAANTHINNATNFLLDRNASKEGVSEQLDSIELSITVIREWLTKDD